MTRVTWRGVTVDKRTARMLDEVARLSGDIYVRPTQGSFSGSVAASAGTHDGCGAVDIITGGPDTMRQLVPIMRRVGFAAWLRTPAQSSWPYHVHAIAVQPGGKSDRGCLSSGAHAQVIDYYNGLNGLAGRGRDDATRAHVGTTWETYQEDDMPLTDNDIDKIARAVWSYQMNDHPARFYLTQSWRIARRWLGASGSAPKRTRQQVILATVRGIDEKVDEFGKDDG